MSDLEDFLTPIHVMPPGDDVTVGPWKPLPPDVERDLQQRLDAFDAARGAALVSSQNYFVR